MFTKHYLLFVYGNHTSISKNLSFAYSKMTSMDVKRGGPLVRNDWFHMPNDATSHAFRCRCARCRPVSRLTACDLLYPEAGFPSFGLVEVAHGYFDPPNTGFWFYHAPGSGVWINLTKTIAFRSHDEAMRKWSHVSLFSHLHAEARIANVARYLGFDTVQFTRFKEHDMVKHEIMMTGVNTGQPRLFSPCSDHAYMFVKHTRRGDCASVDGEITRQCRQCLHTGA
jgi:hypothetical protein